MEWWLALIVIFGGLGVLFVLSIEVAVCFLVISFIGVQIWWGGFSGPGPSQVILGLRAILASFAMLPIVLFTLMGEVMFRSTIAQQMLNALDKWVGRVPGRLSLLATAGGTIVATTSGSSIAATAMLGEVLVPEMRRHGYKNDMILGPIMGSGGLAVMIPPSALAIVVGAIAQESIAAILIGIIMPGLVLAAVYAIYIIIRCRLQPDLAPAYEVASSKLSTKLVDTAKYILPLGFIIFLVTGVIMVGIASPSEAAATGTLGSIILAAAYRRVNWDMMKKSLMATAEVSVMVLFIIMASAVFSQILVFSGASRGLVQFSLSVPLPPIGVVISMQILLIILGMFINPIAIMMITIPIFMPIIKALGFDPTWFLVLFLLNSETGGLTPPFGMLLYTMQGVAPGTSFQDCFRSAIPFLICQVLVLALVLFFPPIALWLPRLMR